MVPELLRKADQAFGGLVLTQFVVAHWQCCQQPDFGFNFPMVVVLLDRGEQAKQEAPQPWVKHTCEHNWLHRWGSRDRLLAGSLVGQFSSDCRCRCSQSPAGPVLDSRAPQRRILHLAIDVCCFVLAVVVGSSSLFYNQPLLMLSAVLYGNSHQRRLTFGEVVATTDVVFAEDGVNDSIAVVRTDANVSLRVNGKFDASTGDAQTQLLLGHLGAVLHSMPRRVLIVGFGSGMTASAVARYPDVEEIDCVEIEPAVIHAAPYLGSLNRVS